LAKYFYFTNDTQFNTMSGRPIWTSFGAGAHRDLTRSLPAGLDSGECWSTSSISGEAFAVPRPAPSPRS
jgi:hypothetical protein